MCIGDDYIVPLREEGMMTERKKAMANAHKAQVAIYGTPISTAEYRGLRDYAEAFGVRLSGFKNYVGDVAVIKTVIDDIAVMSKDFPRIIDERNGIVLHLDYDMSDDDFATTDNYWGHEIQLNAGLFSDLSILEESYDQQVQAGRFVKNTNWRSIVRHEVGHVVANLYRFDVIKFTEDTFGIKNRIDILERLKRELSLYSAEYFDCREVISECFSAYYSKVDNKIAYAFVMKCINEAHALDLSMEGR